MKRTRERRQGAVGSVAKWRPLPTALPLDPQTQPASLSPFTVEKPEIWIFM